MTEPTLFSKIEEGEYAQRKAERLIEEILGVELLGISFDVYDASFEIYPESDVRDVVVTEEQDAAIMAMGCSRYWINFVDGSERYCRGPLKPPGNRNNWAQYNNSAEQARSLADQVLAAYERGLEDAIARCNKSADEHDAFNNTREAFALDCVVVHLCSLKESASRAIQALKEGEHG